MTRMSDKQPHINYADPGTPDPADGSVEPVRVTVRDLATYCGVAAAQVAALVIALLLIRLTF